MPANWLHELRNAVNAACTSAAAVQMLLDRGQWQRAAELNQQILAACDRCRQLLNAAPALLEAPPSGPEAMKPAPAQGHEYPQQQEP